MSGVPNGSMLGPVLFLIFIIDLPSYVECFVKLFADDTKLCFTVNSPTDCHLIQQDIDQMNRWSDCWLLMFNAKKCKVVHYGNSNSHNQCTLKALVGSTSILEEVQNECDFGIIFDSKNTLHRLLTRQILLLG